MVSTQVGFEVVRRFGSWLVAAILLSCLSPAFAQTPLSNEQTLEAERLGEQGVTAFEAGHFDQALAPLESGYGLSGWGTIGIWLAKTHEKLNQPLEAFRVYSEVAATPAIAGEPAPFVQAREDAKAAVARLEQSYAVVEFESEQAIGGLQVTVNGETRRLSKANSVAVVPGDIAVEARWEGKALGPKSLTLQAGQHEVVELIAAASADAKPATASAGLGKGEATPHTLDFSMVELTGWTLHDERGTQICALPCKWSGTNAETLTVRHGDKKLPVRIARRYARDPALAVTVNPRRGSKGLALGLGIPAGILFAGSLLVLPESDYPAVTATGAAVFGAGFGVCVWWFIWSKSHPYLDYEVPEAKPAAKKASIGLDFYGNGLGVSGSF